MRDIKQFEEYFHLQKEDMIERWKKLVNQESHSREPETVTKAAELVSAFFSEAGIQSQVIPTPPNGSSVIGTNSRSEEKGVVFSGHIDTVFPQGSWGADPFRIEGNQVTGPGALDMKGGIIIALFVIKAFQNLGGYRYPFTIVFSGDEEIGHSGSKGSELISEAVEGAVCAFNMETGRKDNSICTGRKGRSELTLNVRGIEAHAGAAFSKGRNAIEELAEKIVRIRKLTQGDTTVATTLIAGGTAANAIPDQAEAVFDIRYKTAEDLQQITAKIDDIIAENPVDGISMTIKETSALAAFETTEQVQKLFDFTVKVAEKYQLALIQPIYLGGSSDASYIANAGVPVLCAMGVQGERNHTKDEHALFDSMFDRMKLITAVLLELENNPQME